MSSPASTYFSMFGKVVLINQVHGNYNNYPAQDNPNEFESPRITGQMMLFVIYFEHKMPAKERSDSHPHRLPA